MTITDLKRTRVSADQRREIIIRAAAGLFAEHGYAGTRLDQVAAQAGVTKPIIYRHFASKKALYLTLLERHRADLPRFLATVDPGLVPGSPDAIRAVLDHWLDYVRDNSHAWLMLFRDGTGDQEIRAFRRAVSGLARQVIAEFIGGLPGRPVSGEQVEPTAELLRSGLAGLALWWIDHPDVPKQVVLETAARLSAAPLAPGPAGGQAGLAQSSGG